MVVIMAVSSGCGLFQKMLTSMNIHPELVKRDEEFPGSQKCGHCHIDIYKEWAESTHSKSYISKVFRVATNNYEFEFCIRCHAPKTIFTSLENNTGDNSEISVMPSKNGEIEPRDYNLKDGVDCQGCHLTVDCEFSGPHTGISPHPLKKNEEFYKSSELCGKCHIDTFEEYLTYAGNGNDETCQDCHMPAVRRKLIQDEPWQKLHKKKEGKAHTFSRLSAREKDKDFMELKFTEINNDNKQIAGNVEIINTKVNHSIPTGKYGYREVILLINLKDNLGRIIKSKQESMFVELDTQIKPGEKKIYNFVFDLDDESNWVKELEAVLLRTNFNRTDKTQFARVELQLSLQK
jgi:nitrate/TMAO reductase-like tetraheme cytochrome c subunit